MQAKFLVNGVSACSVDAADRGLAYGDGVFETMLVAGNHWVLWRQHLNRLNKGIKRLGLPYTVNELLQERVMTVINHFRKGSGLQGKRNDISQPVENCVVKIIITRGSGGRGYFPQGCDSATEILACFPFSAPDQRLYKNGIDVRILSRIARSDQQLAGIKHLNRLEQVMASGELAAAEFEGVMCDVEGRLVEGTRSNIVLKRDGHWITPTLVCSGVRGVMRQFLLEGDESLGFTIVEKDISQAECCFVQAMAMVNSVFGIIPVRKIDSFELDINCVINEIQNPVHQALRL